MFDLNSALANLAITADCQVDDLEAQIADVRLHAGYPGAPAPTETGDYDGAFTEGSKHPGAVARGKTSDLMESLHGRVVAKQVALLEAERDNWREIGRWARKGRLYCGYTTGFWLKFQADYKTLYAEANRQHRIEHPPVEKTTPLAGDKYIISQR
jgi:hypothetical protein